MSDLRERIIAYMKFRDQPCATWWMRLAGIGSAAQLRRELRKMEAEDIVRVSKRYTSSNNLVWELTND